MITTRTLELAKKQPSLYLHLLALENYLNECKLRELDEKEAAIIALYPEAHRLAKGANK